MLSSHLAHRVGLLTTLLLPIAFANPARALPPIGAGGGQHAGSGVGKELHAAKHLLEHADHDYSGYREKAIHHINEAMHDLHGSNQKGNGGGAGKASGIGGQQTPHAPRANGNGNAPKLKEPQGNSDAQLREAAQILAAAEGKLGSHPKAHAEVQAALNDIALALKRK